MNKQTDKVCRKKRIKKREIERVQRERETHAGKCLRTTVIWEEHAI
jgi:hypothetical protein